MGKSNPEEPLFTTNRGNPYSPSYLSQYVRKEIALMYKSEFELVVNYNPHYFRHAFAIISHTNRVDIYEVMRSLGHQKIETTKIYLDKIFAKERHAIHSWKSETFGEYI